MNEVFGKWREQTMATWESHRWLRSGSKEAEPIARDLVIGDDLPQLPS